MNRIGIISVGLAMFVPACPAVGQDVPLIEFGYVDTTYSARDLQPVLEQCGYYFLVRGVLGYSGGFRPGARVDVHADTLEVQVNAWAAYPFDPRNWTEVFWTLRIGNLERAPYFVRIAVGGKVRIGRWESLSFEVEGCAA